MHGPTRFALVAIATLLLAACGLQEGLDQRPDAGGAQVSQAPAISGTTLTGQALAWSSVRGHPIVLDFWASWCGPCKSEAPWLERQWLALRAKGVVVLGIDYNDLSSDARRFVGRHGMTYPVVRDRNGDVTDRYNVTGVPETFFVGKTGKLVGKHIAGPVDEGKNRALFRASVAAALRS